MTARHPSRPLLHHEVVLLLKQFGGVLRAARHFRAIPHLAAERVAQREPGVRCAVFDAAEPRTTAVEFFVRRAVAPRNAPGMV